MSIYTCSAVIRDMVCTDDVQAVSEKQAWYKFSMKYGFKQRDFKILGVQAIKSNNPTQAHVPINPQKQSLSNTFTTS